MLSRSTSSCSGATCSTRIGRQETAYTAPQLFSGNTLLTTSRYKLNFSVIPTKEKPKVARTLLASSVCDEMLTSMDRFPAINYEDPHLNVGIPVFSIHGNHDDPQGAGPVRPFTAPPHACYRSLTLKPRLTQEGALCALDLLSVAGLINYIGKVDLPSDDTAAANTTTDSTGGGGIQIKPVLLQKGSTKLALYGVGNVKDQRMHFELRSNRVRMFMPRDKDDWFNILMVHQNRSVFGMVIATTLIDTDKDSLTGLNMVRKNTFRKACSTIASTL